MFIFILKSFLFVHLNSVELDKFGVEDIVDLLNKNFLGNLLFKDERENVTPPNSSKSTASSNSVNGLVDNSLHVDDLYGALQFTLFNQIPLKSTLNSTQLLILQRFLRSVHRYFPFDEREPALFIERLLNLTLRHTHSLPIELYLKELRDLNYDFSSRFNDWKTCKGSSPNYRGYPCSLWSLFHTLTVREYVHAQREQKWVNLHEVLFTMRDYIASFFSCSHCATHFASMAKDLEQQLQQPNSSVLWMWNAHNIVNRRLSKDLTEDPQHPKQQFPSEAACSSCWIKTEVSTGTTDATSSSSNRTIASTKRFNETRVLEFLISRYDLHLPPYHPPSSSSFSALQSDSANGNVPRRMLFDYTDISICFTLYFLTTILLFTIFFVLRMRNRRKHSKYSKKPLPFGDF
jgi:hypothetical protein